MTFAPRTLNIPAIVAAFWLGACGAGSTDSPSGGSAASGAVSPNAGTTSMSAGGSGNVGVGGG